MGEYTKGRLDVRDDVELLSQERFVANCGGFYRSAIPDGGRAENEANAERLAACWNALEGMDPAIVGELVTALNGLLDALAMGPLDIAAKYGPDAHPDEPVVDAAHKASAVLKKVKHDE